MASEFQVAQVEFGDLVGLGAWQVGHARQHLRYDAVLAARSPPIILPPIPLFRIGENKEEIRTWFQDHYFNVHLLLRQYSGITGGSDFSIVDLSKPEAFYDFLDVHFIEHTLLDAALGVA
jgi:hypothetical protein